MTYRMDSAKQFRRSSWGYEIDYDKEIAQDERDIAFYSSEFAKRIAAETEANVAKFGEKLAYVDMLFFDFLAVSLNAVEIAALGGLSLADVRALLAVFEVEDGELWARLGGEPTNSEWKAGYALSDKLSVDGVHKWGELRTFRENEKRGRAALLKKAKSSLSRHKRNKEKYGR